MKLEHFALNVEEPNDMAEWYVANLGMRITKQVAEPPFTTFLADDSGTVMIEIYKNPPHEVPPYRLMDPLQVHLAYVSADPSADMARLIEAGASMVSENFFEDGSHLVMLRDPWGLALQLCKRGKPMI